MMDVMIDIETLALTPKAHILSIGAVKFNESEKLDTFYTAVHASQARDINADTVAWWAEQDKEARDAVFNLPGDKPHLSTALFNLSSFCEGVENIWSCHHFDIMVLENAAAQCGVPPLWTYRQPSDYGTVVKIWRRKTGLKWPVVPGNTQKHNALADAEHQTMRLQSMLRDLWGGE